MNGTGKRNTGHLWVNGTKKSSHSPMTELSVAPKAQMQWAQSGTWKREKLHLELKYFGSSDDGILSFEWKAKEWKLCMRGDDDNYFLMMAVLRLSSRILLYWLCNQNFKEINLEDPNCYESWRQISLQERQWQTDEYTEQNGKVIMNNKL